MTGIAIRRWHRWVRTPAEGADTIVWLAAGDEAEGQTGLFWMDREPRPTHKTSRNKERPERRRELRDALSELSGLEQN